MADFNNTNLADFSGVWVFCEQRQGKLQPTVLELISEARKLADDMGTEVCGLLLGGKGVADSMAKELGAYGADKVLVCESICSTPTLPMLTQRLSATPLWLRSRRSC